MYTSRLTGNMMKYFFLGRTSTFDKVHPGTLYQAVSNPGKCTVTQTSDMIALIAPEVL